MANIAVNTYDANGEDTIYHIYRSPLFNNNTIKIILSRTRLPLDESGISTGGVYIGSKDSNLMDKPVFKTFDTKYQNTLSEDEIYNMMLTTVFLFLLMTVLSLVLFVLMKKRLCLKCLPFSNSGNVAYMSRRINFHDVIPNSRPAKPRSAGTPPPPYENPPAYSTLPKEILIDPKDLQSPPRSPNNIIKPQNQNKTDLTINITEPTDNENQNEEPVAPPRKQKSVNEETEFPDDTNDIQSSMDQMQKQNMNDHDSEKSDCVVINCDPENDKTNTDDQL